MITVTLYRTILCEECDQIEQELRLLQEEIPHKVVVIDLESHPEFEVVYGNQVPVVEVGPYKLRKPIHTQDLFVTLGAARDRSNHLEQVGDRDYQARLERGHTLTRTDRFTRWLANHYTLLFNMIIFIYVFTPFLAPVFLKVGLPTPARVIYTLYSPLCHQFGFRSWFLFGDQLVYPRELAQVSGVMPYEQAIGLDSHDVRAARSFIGNEFLGYKVALCQRDIAIYGSVLLFGLIFSLRGRQFKSIPWYLWILVGIIPIALDGFSQLPGLTNSTINWLPVRESTPLLRTLTGSLFGLTTAWYGYPYVEETMAETRRILARKNAVISQT